MISDLALTTSLFLSAATRISEAYHVRGPHARANMRAKGVTSRDGDPANADGVTDPGPYWPKVTGPPKHRAIDIVTK